LAFTSALVNVETDYTWAFNESARAVRFQLVSDSPSASTRLHSIEVAFRRRGRP
jgi:hypothetical protein